VVVDTAAAGTIPVVAEAEGDSAGKFADAAAEAA
jgi:hypothetical protein